MYFDPFKPNGISHCYQLEKRFCFKGGRVVHLYSNFNRTFSKQTVETLIRRHVLWRLVWVCTICLRPTKMMLGLYGLNYVCSTMFFTCSYDTP